MSHYKILNISLTKESFTSNNAAAYQLNPKPLKDGLKFEIQANQVGEAIHEISMTLVFSVAANIAEEGQDEKFQDIFEVQSTMSGLFEIQGFNQDDFDKIVKVHCATALYPYCRERVTNVVGASPFPSGMLPTINFAEMYEQQQFSNATLAEQEQKEAEEKA